MLGSFNFQPIGKFVLSGDNPDEFLWDLFDQVVSDGNCSTNLGGATVIANNVNGYSQDYQERLEARGSEAWQVMHSNHFCNKICNGIVLFAVSLNPSQFFDMHKMSLLGLVISEDDGQRDNMRRNNIALYKHGHGTEAYYNELKSITTHDYPYEDLESVNVLNYLILKGTLTIKGTPFNGLLTASQVSAFYELKDAESQSLQDEQRRLALAYKTAQKKIRNPKPRTKKKV